MGMLKTVSQAWKVAEIRSKMLFTLMMLIIFRIGSNIPVPNINRDILSQMFTSEAGLFDLFDLFSGGAFSNFTIFALSITPYITASIVVNLLSMAFPYFQRLAQEGTQKDGADNQIYDGGAGTDTGGRTYHRTVQRRHR